MVSVYRLPRHGQHHQNIPKCKLKDISGERDTNLYCVRTSVTVPGPPADVLRSLHRHSFYTTPVYGYSQELSAVFIFHAPSFARRVPDDCGVLYLCMRRPPFRKHITTNQVLYDLGCGDGRICISAAERRGAKACGKRNGYVYLPAPAAFPLHQSFACGQQEHWLVRLCGGRSLHHVRHGGANACAWMALLCYLFMCMSSPVLAFRSWSLIT